MALQRATFDAIVLDLMMRGVSGFDVIVWLEKNRRIRKSVVVISAASPTVLATAGKSAVVERVIRKPFDMPDLVSAVRECVGDLALEASVTTAAGRR